jgi:ActR/RegA family two-component response regulator
MEQVDSLLKSSEQGMEAVVAQTFAIELEQIERIERMIMHAEVRRNAALRELDRHREALARKLKIEQIEDAEFTEVPGQEVMDEAKDRAA